MERRKFLVLSGLSLAAGCTGRESSRNAPGPLTEAGTEGRFYPPVVQRSPLGHRVIHDRMTYIEQYKYENWELGRDWNDDAQLWKDFSYCWGQGTLPIQRRPLQVLEDLYLLGPEDYHQCIYLWDTGQGLLLVDPSYSRFRPMIETQIRQLGYQLEEVKWVLLTHMHTDHIESAAAYEQRGAAVYVHPDDAEVVTGKKKAQSAEVAEPVRSPVSFADGEELVFGSLRMKVIHTPGHTPGASCFSLNWKGNSVLLSEDIVLHWGRHAWMGADYCDWDHYLASLWKLHEHPEAKTWQVLLPGHGTIDLEGAGDSLYAVIQVVSEIIRRRRAGSDIDWIDPYELFWQREKTGGPEIEVLKS